VAHDSPISSRLPFGEIGPVINRKILSGTDYRQVLEDLFAALIPYIPFDRIGIALIEGENVVSKWMKSTLEGNNLDIGYAAPLKGSSLEKVFRTKRPRIISDLKRHLVRHPISDSTKRAIDDGIRSSLTFPLLLKDQVIGFIFFSSARTGTYDHTHINLFADVAAEISMLIRFGQLRDFFQAWQMKDSLMRVTIHELRAPLAVIQGYLDFMKGEDWFQNLSSDQQGLFDILKRNSEGMLMLISDLAESNQLILGKGFLKPTRANLSVFSSEIIRFGHIFTARKNMRFWANVDSNLPSDWVFDEIRIKQVLTNLLTNAVKFSSPGDHVALSIRQDGNSLVFIVEDTGQGIASSELSNLFKDFGKTSTKPTDGEPSTGLGLALCKRIIESHGGEISVHSQLGQGSIFWFRLPHRIPLDR
jgi:signal transduction histidine kinase